ncbi:GntR family transcriptional regulator [Pleionea sp. CnH1-48]|uniref:GntR family transcriptional regulator n=1 Tax=Pleionea sp. CnH1-48 TaxID=2954494 RepID=UPI002096F6B9|nr:GntR family transcriptional regulator [Pleionea sp. CnH1-48]MCO7226671.1 GntR family transcriptional regulator [Pleionea sp. CnH1-48]
MTDSDLINMEISPSSGVPIYRQIMEQVRQVIASNHLSPGENLPSVRHLASQLEVNPMTISKAYSLLEAEGLLERQRGKGMVVSTAQNQMLDVNQRLELLKPSLEKLINDSRQLDIPLDKIFELLKQLIKEAK